MHRKVKDHYGSGLVEPCKRVLEPHGHQLWILALPFIGVCVLTSLWAASSIFFHKMQINIPILINVVVVQVLSCVQLFATPRTTARQASLSFTISESCLKIMSIESVMPSNHLILCHPLLLLPSSFPASVFFPTSRIFTSGGQSIVASASALVLPMNIRGLFPVGLTGLVALLSKGLSSISSSVLNFLYVSTLTSIHDYWKKK